MDKGNIRAEIYNFFVSVELIPVLIYKFVVMWLAINSTVKKTSKVFSKKLLEIGLPEKASGLLTKEYASTKDYIFEGFLKRRNRIQNLKTKKSGGLRNVLIKMLPYGSTFSAIQGGRTKDVSSAVFLDATKMIILMVGIFRALERDVYWVAVCITAYALYSSLFGIASELIDRHQNSTKGLLGSVVNVIGEAFSDTKVIAIVGLALSSHSILGAPFVPLYHVIPNLDSFQHYISGFGVGLIAIKVYEVFVSYISYSKALTMFDSMELSHQISLLETSAELPFVCYFSIFVGLVWEGLEEIAEKFTPRVVNVFFWNGVLDIFMGLLGALTAYVLVSHSFIIKKHENCSNSNDKTRVDPQAVKRASDIVLAHMNDVTNSVYSESSAKKFSKEAATQQLTKTKKA